MVDNIDRTPYRCWKIILEVERFISLYADDMFKSRHTFRRNYLTQLKNLLDCDQLLIERDGSDKLKTVCGWARINKADEHQVNKIRWTLPASLCEGNVLYISFCICADGNIRSVRRELVKRYADVVDEVYWFNTPKQKYCRRKNILKEKALCKTAG